MDEKSLFFDALNQPAGDERNAWLDDVCGQDLPLRQRIAALLRRHEQAGSFLEQRPPEFAATIIPGASDSDRARALQAGLAAAFAEDQALCVGSAGHSLLKSVDPLIDVPRVVLRELDVAGNDPITRPNSPEMPNRNADSRYQLQGEIARGGMGVILKGRDTNLGRDLAIKVLLDQHKDKPEIVQRFVEEAQIGGQLQHPGIAPIYELGQFSDKRPFFAMKLVRGETLSKLLADRKSPAEDRARFIGIFEQVCQTMAYAHSRGVIHRDLKPTNIMVGAFGEIQVIDWGLAKVLSAGGVADEKRAHDKQQAQSIIQTLHSGVDSDVPGTVGAFSSLGSQTRMGSVMGTPAYMPLEQALGEIENLDERADVFGLGAILCEILTGKPPYVADGAARVFRMASSGKLEDCFERLASCGADEDLVTLTKHCLELEPADRPRNAGVLASRIVEYIESVETRLREVEIQLATEAARANAEAAQAAAERQRAEAEGLRAEAERQRAEFETQRVEQQQRSAGNLRRMLGGLTVVALVAGVACVAALIAHNRANDLAKIARRNESDANFFAGEATAKAKLASENAARAEAEADLARKEMQRAEAATEQAKAQLIRSEWLLYASKLTLARNNFEAGNGGLAAYYLNESQPELRGWEYRYLATRIRSRQTLAGHTAPVHSVACSPDGKHIVTGSWDQTARVWDAATGQESLTLRGHAGYVMSVAFSPDGYPVQSVAFSPDGRHLATGVGAWGIGNGEAILWDAATGQKSVTFTGHTAAVLSVAFSPDGQHIATSSWDQTIKVWNSQTGGELLTLKGHEGYVRSLAFSPDGRRIVTGSNDQTAKVWDADHGQEIPTLKGHTDGITSAAFSSNSRHLVTGSLDNTARVWNTVTGQEVLRLKMHSKYPSMWDVAAVWGVAISPDGQRIATSSQDRTARVWDAATGKELLVIKHADVVSGIAFNPDGKQLVTGCFDHTARVWDAVIGRELFTLNGHAGHVNCVAFSPDGQHIVTGSQDHTAKVWDTTTGQELFTLRGHVGYVVSVAYSPDGQRIVTGGQDNTAKVWDAVTGQELITLKGHTGGSVRCVAFSPDGARIVTGSDDRTARLWDTATGQEVPAFSGHAEAVYAVAWSPDGNRIATGIAGANGTARLWDAATARELLVLAGHTEMVTRVAFSDDGQRIFAWDQQQNLLAWSVPNGEPVTPVDPPSEPLPGPASSPDGFHHAAPEGNTVVVSDTRPLPENAWPLPNAVQRVHYHSEVATLAKQKNQTFAADFHLQQVTLAEAELAQTEDTQRHDTDAVEGKDGE